jgi:enoyl-[acyl-carrier protein] reductase II
LKAAQAGVDAIVAEGFEAGGHNGREETTTLCLIPQVREALNSGGYRSLPLIAAGGVASGGAIAACLALGADGVQIGSLFAAAEESSAHENFKKAILEAGDGATQLTLKELTPVRLLKNPFWQAVQAAYTQGASAEELAKLLGRGRAKKGMFEGDLEEGELEIGQVSAQISSVSSAASIIEQLNHEYHQALQRLK